MFFPTLGLHRRRTIHSPNIDGSLEIPVGVSVVPDSTILVLGNNINSVAVNVDVDNTMLITGASDINVAISLQP